MLCFVHTHTHTHTQAAFDEHSIEYEDMSFTMISAPQITALVNDVSIMTGGTTVTLCGKGLSLVDKPLLLITAGKRDFTTVCSDTRTVAGTFSF